MRIGRFVGRLVLGLALIALVLLVVLRGAAAWRESLPQDAGLPSDGRLVETPSGRIYVEEHGEVDAPAILLVHGSVGWSGLWRNTMSALSREGYRAIAFDLPPMGWSDRSTAADFGRVAQAKRVADLARALDAQPIIVAHSFGAGPALEAALREPELFSGIIVVSGAMALGGHDREATLPLPLRSGTIREMAVSATVANPPAMRPLLRQFLHRKEGATDAVIAVLNEPMRRDGTTPAVAAWLPSLLLPPRDALSTRPEEIAQLDIPAALIWGDRDRATPLEQGRALEAALPDAPLTVLTEIGHIPQIEDHAGFISALLGALSHVSRAPNGG